MRFAVIVVVFFLEASGEARLQSISGAGVRLKAPSRPPDGAWGRVGREGRLAGISLQSPWRRALPRRWGHRPHWPGLRAEGWTSALCSCAR